MEKVRYLDGLRGVAAFVVVLGHFCTGFFPALYFGESAISHTKNLSELWISASPLNLFYNGDFAVCIFFILSGFVLSYKYFLKKDSHIIVASSLKRYFRLVIPIVFITMLSYILMKVGLFFNDSAGLLTGSSWLQSHWNFHPKFWDAIRQGFFGTLFQGSYKYDNVLWTMSYEFFGSFIVFGFLALFGSVKNRFVIYAILIFLFLKTYYVAFILGIMLSDLRSYNKYLLSSSLDKSKIIRLTMLLTGLYLGSFPAGRSVDGTIYAPLQIIGFQNAYVFYHVMGAFFVMVILLSSKRLQNIFSHKVPFFLGKVSFSMYLVHLLIIGSISSQLFIALSRNFSYINAFAISFLISIPIIIVVSNYIYKYVDSFAVRSSYVIYEKIFGK